MTYYVSSGTLNLTKPKPTEASLASSMSEDSISDLCALHRIVWLWYRDKRMRASTSGVLSNDDDDDDDSADVQLPDFSVSASFVSSQFDQISVHFL